MVEDVFPAPPPAEPDPRACHLAVRMVNRKPLATDFSPPAALDILVVDTGVPSPPASLLSSQTLLSTPMTCALARDFLLVSAAWGSPNNASGTHGIVSPIYGDGTNKLVWGPQHGVFGELNNTERGDEPTANVHQSTGPRGQYLQGSPWPKRGHSPLIKKNIQRVGAGCWTGC